MNGRDLFGLDIAGLILDVLGGELRDGSLEREVFSARDPDNLAAGRQRTVEVYPFQGFVFHSLVDEMAKWGFQNTVTEGRRRVLVLGRSVEVEPRAGDVLVLDGERYAVFGVYPDPAQATFTCVIRD